MDIYYVNHKGVRIDLNKKPYIFSDTDVFDWNWDHDDFLGIRRNKIKRTYKRVQERSFKLAICPNLSVPYDMRAMQFMEDVDSLHEVIETDIVANKTGRLYCGKEYMECMISSSTKSSWYKYAPFIYHDMTVLIPNHSWINELSLEFKKNESNSESSEYLDYEFDYEYEYYMDDTGVKSIDIDHFIESDFKMIIYGPCVDPRVLINKYPYQVLVTLEENEYIVIDSRNQSVIKVMATGDSENIFDLRNKKNSIFNKIPGGSVTFNWDGQFGFDMTVFMERSQPSWSL